MGGYYPLYPPEYASGWKGGGEGREVGGVVVRPRFEGASISSRSFFKAFKNSTKCFGSGSGAKSPDPTGSATLHTDIIYRTRKPGNVRTVHSRFCGRGGGEV